LPRSAQVKQISSIPVTWLSDGKLKLNILLRHEAARTGRMAEAVKCLREEEFSRKHILSLFQGIANPDRDLMQKASDDYLRCILAKGVDEVYKKYTPKYRNEAARRQFFKRLVGIAEGIHLSQSNEKLHELLTPSESDDVALWVNTELEAMIARRVDLATEFSSRLAGARTEFRASLRQLENLIGTTWEESDRYHGTVSLTSYFSPGVVEDEETWRWGAQWDAESNVLNINPPILFLDIFRKAVLAREAAILLSPRILDRMERAPRVLCEQAEYLAYNLLERKNDREIWEEARHGLRKETKVGGHELIDFFHYYEMLVGESLYREVWSRLKEFGDARLTVSDYYIIYNTLAARPTNPTFDTKEIQLLRLLAHRPDVAPGEAARTLRVSIPTAMKTIRDISRKAGLRFTHILDARRVGLNENLVLVNTLKQADVLRILTRFPYCRQVFRTYGSFDLFCVLDIPEEYSQFTAEFFQRMTDRKLIMNYRLTQLERDLQAINFDHYDITRSRWDIHWDSWGISLREALLKREYGIGAQSPSQDQKLQLDKLDMRILSWLHVDCRLPFSSIGRTLGVSGAYVGKKVARMIRERVVRYAIWPLKIGSEDWGVVGLSCEKQTADVLARHLSMLPAWRGGFVTGDFNGMIAIVWAPNGELKQLFKAIDDRLVRTGYAKVECLNPVGEWVVARWLPVDPDTPLQLFTEEGKWMFDENRYMALIG
jgi:DNA-binding Lrp family transcriptional regulator